MLRQHMDNEELALRNVELTPEEESEIRDAFTRIEAEVLTDRTRATIIDLAHRIRKHTPPEIGQRWGPEPVDWAG